MSSPKASRRWWCGSARRWRRSTTPGLKLQGAAHRQRLVYDTRLLLLEPPTEQVILGDQKRLEVQP